MEDPPEIYVVEHGYVRVVVSARTTDLGFGVTIEVFGRLPENCWKEALRFDCFDRDPHWHQFPATGGSVEERLAASSCADAVTIAVGRLRSGLAVWMTDLGYPEGSREIANVTFENVFDRIAQSADDLQRLAVAHTAPPPSSV